MASDSKVLISEDEAQLYDRQVNFSHFVIIFFLSLSYPKRLTYIHEIRTLLLSFKFFNALILQIIKT